MDQEQSRLSRQNASQGVRPGSPDQLPEPPSETPQDLKTWSYRLGKRIAVVAVCSIVGSFTSIIVTSAITYVALSWPLYHIIPLGGNFDFFLFPAMIIIGGFFGAVASFLLALAYAQATERAVWGLGLAMPTGAILLFLSSGHYSDATISLILGVGTVCGMHMSKKLCLLFATHPGSGARRDPLRTNFGRNIQLNPQVFYTPESEQEVLEILSRHRGQRVQCIGRLHSWSKVIEADDVLLDLRHLNQVVAEAYGPSPSVVVGAGCQIKRLLEKLQHAEDWTLPSVGFITEQTIAGAISTGTHGSGRHSLSHYVSALWIARYDAATGSPIIEEINSGDSLRAARCSLGCLGVILRVRMECRPAYAVEEHFHEYDRLGDVLALEDEYPQQQFYLVPWRWTYFVQHRRETDRPTSKSLSLYHWYRFLTLDITMHLLILLVVRLLRSHLAVRATFRWIAPAFVIRDWRVVGSSNSQLVMEHELFRHVEIEMFVQRSKLEPALLFLKQVLSIAGDLATRCEEERLEAIIPTAFAGDLKRLAGTYCHHYPICVRKILPDDTLISMASRGYHAPALAGDNDHATHEEPWYSITLTNYQRGVQREPFERLAGFLARSMTALYRARPHWGKLCPLSPTELGRLYPDFRNFQEIWRHCDPDQVFANPWTQNLLDRRAGSSDAENL